MATNFTYATLEDATRALAARLYESSSDTTQQFWTPAELTVYIVEALRTWNAVTSFWRSEFSFAMQPSGGTGGSPWWYDITQQAGTVRPVTVTDTSVFQSIQYSLLEPVSSAFPLTWGGSLQFDMASILDAITRRQNQVLGKTGCTIAQNSLVAQFVARTVLADTAIDIRRVAWLPTSGLGFVNTILKQSDLWAKRAFDPGWTVAEASPPYNWMQSAEPPPAFDVDRIPPVTGNYDVLTVNAGAVAGSDVARNLVVPDDWSWLVKWGAMADLLSRESEAADPARAAYCQQRFDMGCQLLTNAPSVLALQVNGVPLFVDPVRNGDDFNPMWQAQAAAQPQSAYSAGLNLLGFPAQDTTYSALVSCVQNAPVPVLSGDYIQIARSDYDTMLDEAQHIAMFKSGGAEFARTGALHNRFIQQAALYNSKLKAMGQFQSPMYEIAGYESKRNARV